MSKAEALMTIGHVYYRLGEYPKAIGYWDRVPEGAFKIRHGLYQLYLHTQHTLDMEQEVLGQPPDSFRKEAITSTVPV